ncbi:MAG: OadG family protein [Clostridiales bacterium]|nr:OadG family protein [Clostridiales bacterium]
MDRLMLGLSTTVIGMLVVFFGLVILIACIYAMTSFTGRGARKAATETKAAPAPAPEAAPLPEPEETEDDGAVVAAIAAAIALIFEKENNPGGFVVRRVRRSVSSSARARAARDEQIFSRL